ncbi:MAG: hypothetical protein WC511_06630 [Candidatus Pacearchaeota archaeon]|jgi:hypothetical protein
MPNIYTNITAAAPTTTAITTGPVILSGLMINKATATGVITIYDGIDTTGTVVATITSPATLLQNQLSIDYHDICLKKGLTIVTATAAQDITVSYRK